MSAGRRGRSLLAALPAGRKDEPSPARIRREVMGLRTLAVLLLIVFGVLQLRLWFGDGNVRQWWRLQEAVVAQAAVNERLSQRNHELAAEVQDLKTGLKAIEARARHELGMIKKNETFFQLVESR